MFLGLLRINLIRKMPFYAVARGRAEGIYKTWDECQSQVKGFKGAIFKKFNTKAEAQALISSVASGTHVGISGKAAKALSSKRRAPDTALSDAQPSKYQRTVSDILSSKTVGNYTYLADSEGFVNVFTDGSCEGNGQADACAGLGVYFDEDHPLNTALPVSGRPTNNCGEIQAATVAIKLAKQNNIEKLCINTDSQFVIKSVTSWMKSWKKNNWKLSSGTPVKNKLDFIELDDVLRESKITMKWKYVQAHQGILGNERADRLARQGSEMYRQNKKGSNKIYALHPTIVID